MEAYQTNWWLSKIEVILEGPKEYAEEAKKYVVCWFISWFIVDWRYGTSICKSSFSWFSSWL